MLKHLAILMFFSGLGPSIAYSATGTVRGGEHDTFTRIVIKTNQTVSYQSHFEVKNGKFKIEVVPSLQTLDISKLFARLNAGRVQSVSANSGQIVLELTCLCSIAVHNERRDLLVIDIFEGDKKNDELQHVQPDGQLPTYIWPTSNTMDILKDDASALVLDYSIVDRVAKQINDGLVGLNFGNSLFEKNMMIYGTSSLNFGDSNLSAASPKSHDQRCEIWDFAWDHLQSPREGSDEMIDAVDLKFPFGSNVGERQLLAVKYIREGLFTEASRVLSSIDQDNPFAKFLWTLLSIMYLESAKPVSNFDQSCNQFTKFLYFLYSQKNLEALNDEQILEIYDTFKRLDLGLQLQLLDRLDSILNHVSQNEFFDLFEHQSREDLLIESVMQNESHTLDGFDHDEKMHADALRGIARELRGSGYEAESLQAAFSAYIDSSRYFDAFEVINELPETNQRALQLQLLESLSQDADSITFLEITPRQIVLMRDRMPDRVAEKVMSRFQEEGFPENAIELFRSHPEYANSERLHILAGNALLLQDLPEEAFSLLGTSADDAAVEFRKRAQELGDDQDTLGPNNLSELSGELPTSVNGGQVGQGITDLLSGEGETRSEDTLESSDPISVPLARARLQNATSVRRHVAGLVGDLKRRQLD